MELIDILWAVLVVFGIASILGIVIALADKFLKVEEDPRLEEVTNLLAGANCGGCGYPGCSGFASAIIEGKANSLAPCRPTNPANKEKIKEYLKSTPGPDGSTIELK